ncbi:MAG: hypothetical protein ABIH38_03475 [Patescibacteria group bacterium]
MSEEKKNFNQFAAEFQDKSRPARAYGRNYNAEKPLRNNIKELIVALRKNRYSDWQDPKIPKIHVSSTISRMAFLYEKIRVAIDYKDEHLLRKNAIERILKRWLLEGKIETFDIRTLIMELVRGGYLKNDSVPENVVFEVKQILEKYLNLMKQSSFLKKGEERYALNEWILSLLSVEIENHFFPAYEDQALIEYAYSLLHDKVAVSEEDTDEKTKNTQLYIAIQRAVMKSDDALIRYGLFKLYYPDWETTDYSLVTEIAGHIDALKITIENQINHPIGGLIYRQVKKYIILLQILKDIIKENPSRAEEILSNPNLLQEKIVKACEIRYKKARTKLSRSTFRSVIYILLTKTVLAFVLELPYDVLIYNTVHLTALITNIVFHPLLLIFIAANIYIPAKKNTEKVVEAIRGMIYADEKEFIFAIFKKPIKRRKGWNFVFNLLYLFVFTISFGAIIYVLRRFEFNAASIFLFLLFLCVVSFFGIKNRETMRELIIIDKKRGFIGSLLDFFTLPIIRMGRWLSVKAPKINVFTFVLDFIVEAPFKIFVEVLDEWMNFIKEKKEEIY